MSEILSLEEALSLLKEDYRPKVKKVWCNFVACCNKSFDDKAPKEDFLTYFKFLREEKKWHHPHCGHIIRFLTL